MAEEGEVAVAAEGRGLWVLGRPGRRKQPSHPRRKSCHGGSWRSGRRPSPRPGPRHGLGWRTRSSGLSRAARTQDVRSANNMNDATQTQPQHFTLRSGSSTSGSRKQPRLLTVWLQSPGADQSHAAPLLLGPEPCDSAPVPAELPGKPSYDQLAQDIEAA